MGVIIFPFTFLTPFTFCIYPYCEQIATAFPLFTPWPLLRRIMDHHTDQASLLQPYISLIDKILITNTSPTAAIQNLKRLAVLRLITCFGFALALALLGL
jgi:hypothetical protein